MQLYVDANPKQWSYLLEDAEGEVQKVGVEDFEQEFTTNEAEYEAMIRGLRWLSGQPFKPTELRVFSDSRLVINQVNSEWHVKKAHLVRKLTELWDIASTFKKIRFTWVQRRKNRAGKLLR